MGRKSVFPLYDRLLGGTLTDRIATMRSEGDSFATVAIKLREFGVEVTDETIRRWCEDLGIGKAS